MRFNVKQSVFPKPALSQNVLVGSLAEEEEEEVLLAAYNESQNVLVGSLEENPSARDIEKSFFDALRCLTQGQTLHAHVHK
jgi:hypothetical protein